MIEQNEITLKPMSKGFHNIDYVIENAFSVLPKVGMINIFVKHTSAALMINENADPDVQVDLKTLLSATKKTSKYLSHNLLLLITFLNLLSNMFV